VSALFHGLERGEAIAGLICWAIVVAAFAWGIILDVHYRSRKPK
jgi:hypothetical protein